MPRDADPALLVGRYIPNLVPRPFTLDRDFIEEIRDRISSTGDTVVELQLNGSSGPEKCIAYAEKAKALQSLHEKMKGLASRNGAERP